MDDFARIRQAHRDGLSAREIATQFGVGRDTFAKLFSTPTRRRRGGAEVVLAELLGAGLEADGVERRVGHGRTWLSSATMASINSLPSEIGNRILSPPTG